MDPTKLSSFVGKVEADMVDLKNTAEALAAWNQNRLNVVKLQALLAEGVKVFADVEALINAAQGH